MVAVAVAAPPPARSTSSGPSKRDIEELDGGNDRTTGVWSDGTTLWVADNADGAGDAVYAYNRESGERVEEREFDARTRRIARLAASGPTAVSSGSPTAAGNGSSPTTSPRGSAWRSASSRSPSATADARGIWSDEETMWVLDSRANALFAYGFESGELLAEYALD